MSSHTIKRSVFDKRPSGKLKAGLRLPLPLYRAGSGWVLGGRFLMLTHTGRESGWPHQTLVEVVRHDRQLGTHYVVSGWGEKSDWCQNMQASPNFTIQMGRRRFAAKAESVPVNEAIGTVQAYTREHPLAFRVLSQLFLETSMQPGPEVGKRIAEKMPMVTLSIRSQALLSGLHRS